jgi:two-component system osmolarity sensor histidine kinase EnvZ
MGLKRFLPKSLFGRWLLMLVTPVVLLQIVATTIFYQAHWDSVSRRLALGVAGELALLIDSRALIPDAALQDRLHFLADRHMQLSVQFDPGRRLPPEGPRVRFYSILDNMLAQALRERLDLNFDIDTRRNDGQIEIQVQLPDGVLVARTQEKRLFSTTTYTFLIWMVLTSIVLLGIAILFLRNQVRPIRQLAEAADAFGKGREVAHFRPAGATEVRRAAAAFIAMQRRIQRQISQRTEMLAGVSHDLRTPLTRMKLELELLGDEARTKDLRADIAEMEKMIEGYLAFARGQEREATAATDLSTLLGQVATDARRQGGDVTLRPGASIELPLRANAVKRALTNLVENALRHARHVEIGATMAQGAVEIAVDDDGPGIPPEQREEVFRPFFRVDHSRNRATGGVGLGLTIARDVVRSHGGDITLLASPLGGLRALVRLPV